MASALLIIAIVPILKALTIAHVSTTAIERKTRCLILAQAKLDEIKARLIYSYADDFDEVDISLDGLYLCEVEDDPISSNLREIKVKVGYDLNSDDILQLDEFEVTLFTLIAKR